MRLLIINCVSDRSELALYEGLANSGVEVELFCDPRETQQERLRDSGIPTAELFIRNRFDFHAVRTIRRKLESKTFDAVYAPTSRGIAATLFAVRGLADRPRLITYRGTMGNMNYLNPLCRMSHLHPMVDQIICNCDAVRRFLLSIGVPECKLSVVFKGHDPGWYQAQEIFACESLGISNKAVIVGCMANIRPLKGVDVLVRAVAAAVHRIDIHALVVGEVRDQKIVELAQRLGVENRIHFLGFREDVSACIRACHYTVMPSLRREGVARAVVESMSLRVPVIVSDVGGLPEIVRHNQSGLVVPAGDPSLLAQAMERLGSNPLLCESMGKEAALFVGRELSLLKYITAMQEAFEAQPARSRAAVA